VLTLGWFEFGRVLIGNCRNRNLDESWNSCQIVARLSIVLFRSRNRRLGAEMAELIPNASHHSKSDAPLSTRRERLMSEVPIYESFSCADSANLRTPETSRKPRSFGLRARGAKQHRLIRVSHSPTKASPILPQRSSIWSIRA
jgi:hypothetical protein